MIGFGEKCYFAANFSKAGELTLCPLNSHSGQLANPVAAVFSKAS